MESVSQEERESFKGNAFYLLHDWGLREDSTTTKLRVVFDASAKSTYGKSLNDALYIVPKL